MKLTDSFKLSRDEIATRIASFDAYHRELLGSQDLPFRRPQQGGEDGSLAPDPARRADDSSRNLFMLASNDYLGLSKHPRIRATINSHCHSFGSASSGSPLLSGTHDVTSRLEKRLAALHEMDDSLLFCSTYNANLGTIAGLLTKKDYCVTDQYAHTSIRDGARLAGCKLRRFKHNNPDALRRALDSLDPKRAMVFVDSLYSMEGDFCDLEAICPVVKDYGAMLAVDEAHAVGVVGAKGEGLVRSRGLSSEVDIVTSSLGKALASQGGYVAASRSVCNYLRYFANPYVFSSSLSPINAAIALEAIAIMGEGELVSKVQDNIALAHKLLRERNYRVPAAAAGIIPIAIGDEETTIAVANDLESRGVFVNAVIFPAVPKGHGILRISLSAAHSSDELRWALIEVVEAVNTVRER